MNRRYAPTARLNKSSQIRDMILGLDTPVELGNHTKAAAINLDNAATTPPFKAVAQEIQDQMLFYSSIGRGIGQKAEHTNEIYIHGRDVVLDFFSADKEHYSVFYVGNTTDGMNKLASALIDSPQDMVLTTRMEHHANDLPWRMRAKTVYIETDTKGRLVMEDYERILRRYKGRIKYVAVTAASNVTGYVNDVHAIARIAHRYGAKIVVDGAQIAAHRKFQVMGAAAEENIDFFVFSAHKMYAPYGGGAVIGLTAELNRHTPQFFGGGIIETVTDQKVFFTDAPDLYEAGSPNYPGVVGMIKAMELLQEIGFDYIEAHEQRLLKMALKELGAIPEINLYGDCENFTDRVGILVFTIKDVPNETVSHLLAQYSGIAVRQAAFCAHTYVRRLTDELTVNVDSDGIGQPPAGLIRVSFGIYNTESDVRQLVQTVKHIIRSDEMTIERDTSLEAAQKNGSCRLPYDRC